MGRQKGVTEEKLRALEDYENSEALGAEEKIVLRLADAMAGGPPPRMVASRARGGDRWPMSRNATPDVAPPVESFFDLES